MKILNLVQGSMDWHEARARNFTASEAPAMMGASKYQSRNDLLKQKATGVIPDVTDAQQRIFDKGHQAEASARSIAEGIVGEELFPVTGLSEEYGNLLASFDGLTMLNEVAWEHKLWNESLAEAIRSGELEPHYYWQLEQQLLVSGADSVLFMCSDGTNTNMVSCWYDSVPDRREQLINGWSQFITDLENYQFEPEKVEAIAEKPEALPTLKIQLTGMVTSSNLQQFEQTATQRIDSINTELTTDQHFADAEQTVKFLKAGEKDLDAAKSQALQQTATIDELFSTIDKLKELMRQKRLHLEKLVKAEKENRKQQIVANAQDAFSEWLSEQECPIELTTSFDPATAIKGKKTIKSLQSAADDALAKAKIDTKQQIEQVKSNAALLKEEQGEYDFLFSDWKALVIKDPEDLKVTVKARILEHKQREQEKLTAGEKQPVSQAESGGSPAPASSIAMPEKLVTAAQIQQPETVSITKQEYERLLKAEALLLALQAGGVDNWSGYDDAVQSLQNAA